MWLEKGVINCKLYEVIYLFLGFLPSQLDEREKCGNRKAWSTLRASPNGPVGAA